MLFSLVLDSWFVDLVREFSIIEYIVEYIDDKTSTIELLFFIWTGLCLFIASGLLLVKRVKKRADILLFVLSLIYLMGFISLVFRFDIVFDMLTDVYLAKWTFVILIGYSLVSSLFMYQVGRLMKVNYLDVICIILAGISLFFWGFVSFVASIGLPGG